MNGYWRGIFLKVWVRLRGLRRVNIVNIVITVCFVELFDQVPSLGL